MTSKQQLTRRRPGYVNSHVCRQGAFMGALYAQGLPWDEAHRKVRMYASRMSSVRHLLQARWPFSPDCFL